MDHDPSQHEPEPNGFWRSRHAIGYVVLGAIAAYFLLTEHRAHVFAALPFLLLLACPLMHVFPILVAMYGRLAVTEEAEMQQRFGAASGACAARTPRFVPALRTQTLST